MYLAIVYVSSAKESILGPLTRVSKSLLSSNGTVFAHSFRDSAYNRTSYFLVNSNGTALASSAAQLYASASALDISLKQHVGSHPTLGVCDHVMFCPLSSGDLVLNEAKDATGTIAKDFMEQISPMASVFGYGAVNDPQLALADIRRRLGYFDQITTDNEHGCEFDVDSLASRVLDCSTHAGDDLLTSSGFYSKSLVEMNHDVGVTCVGAVPYVMNFNCAFMAGSDSKLVKQITKAVRLLPGVEALTLRHGSLYEVACNLKNSRSMGPEDVMKVCVDEANSLSLTIIDSYTTGPTEMELYVMFQNASKV